MYLYPPQTIDTRLHSPHLPIPDLQPKYLCRSAPTITPQSLNDVLALPSHIRTSRYGNFVGGNNIHRVHTYIILTNRSSAYTQPYYWKHNGDFDSLLQPLTQYFVSGVEMFNIKCLATPSLVAMAQFNVLAVRFDWSISMSIC